MANTTENYVILTPAGVLYAFSQISPSEQQLALQAILATTQTMSMEEWQERYSSTWLDMFIEEGWVELLDKPMKAPDVPLEQFLRYVSGSLSSSRQVVIGDEKGQCIAKLGISQHEALKLCEVATDLVDFLQRQQKQRVWNVQGQAISFFSGIDMLMPKTSFIFLWIDGKGYWLIIEDEPLLNNRAFVNLVWGIKADKLRIEQALEAKAAQDAIDAENAQSTSIN